MGPWRPGGFLTGARSWAPTPTIAGGSGSRTRSRTPTAACGDRSRSGPLGRQRRRASNPSASRSFDASTTCCRRTGARIAARGRSSRTTRSTWERLPSEPGLAVLVALLVRARAHRRAGRLPDLLWRARAALDAVAPARPPRVLLEERAAAAHNGQRVGHVESAAPVPRRRDRADRAPAHGVR